MVAEIVVTVVAGILLAVAAIGTVYPVLPGSALAIVTLIGWGWVAGSSAAWIAAGIGAFMAACGWAASTVLTGRMVRRHRIPTASIAVGVVCGVVGLFLTPFFGLFLGFAVGLLLSEYVRHRDLRLAVRSSAAALRAAGTGVLIEFTMVGLAASVWMVGVIVHFVTR